jgi:hypothetical protein
MDYFLLYDLRHVVVAWTATGPRSPRRAVGRRGSIPFFRVRNPAARLAPESSILKFARNLNLALEPEGGRAEQMSQYYDKENQHFSPNVDLRVSNTPGGRRSLAAGASPYGSSSACKLHSGTLDKENINGHISDGNLANPPQASCEDSIMSNEGDVFSVDEERGELRIRKEHWEQLKNEMQIRFDDLISDNQLLRDQLQTTKLAGQSKIKELESIIEQQR